MRIEEAGTLSRRQVLGWAVGLAGCQAVPQDSPKTVSHRTIPEGSAPSVIASPVAQRQARYRLLNRATWGVTAADMRRIDELGAPGWVQEQLQGGPHVGLPEPVAQSIAALSISSQGLVTLAPGVEDMRLQIDRQTQPEARQAATTRYQSELQRLLRECMSRHLWRALYSPSQLREHMTWFWLNHFNVHAYKANVRLLLADYEESAIRPHALGRFRDLLGAVVHHPALLRYLDNEQNAVGRINENLGRELLELHTLGVNGGYTQDDVQAVARVLTGHGLRLQPGEPRLPAQRAAAYRRRGLYEFNPVRHDYAVKTVLGRRLRSEGADGLNELLDVLALHPSTARHLCRKLAQFFSGDSPSESWVEQLAQHYLQTEGDIGQVLQLLLLSPQMASPSAAVFKDPMHFVISALRCSLEGHLIVNTLPVQGWIARQGQGLYNRPSPDGYPLESSAWNASGQMSLRFEIARQMANVPPALFRTEATPGASRPEVLPLHTTALYHELIHPSLRLSTQETLAKALRPNDWTALFLSCPDFMER